MNKAILANWRSTLLGIGGIFTIIGAILTSLFDDDPNTIVTSQDIIQLLIMLGVLLNSVSSIFSRDALVSSEESGIRP